MKQTEKDINREKQSKKNISKLDQILANLPEAQYSHEKDKKTGNKNQSTKKKSKKSKQNQINIQNSKTALSGNGIPVENKKSEKVSSPKPAENSQKFEDVERKNSGWNKKRRMKPNAGKNPPVKIIPLGGLGEIGKNMTLFEYDGEIIIVDCGMAFPDDDMLGIDLVIPDFTYVKENKDKIKGLFITHGHEDHIGGVPYLLKELNIPVYATPFSMALIELKLSEKGLLSSAKLNVVKPGDTVSIGKMSVEFIYVNHSIPDSCALAINTPAGTIIETGDFKVDYTPTRGGVIDLARFGELGNKGVLALLSDSTNAERPGSTPSEREVGKSFDVLFKNAEDHRIIIATFASNVHRIQLAIDSAVKFGRKVAVTGKSLEQVFNKALEMGYIEAPSGTIVSIDEAVNLPENETVIVTTGSQGEAMSALARMASGEHKKVGITSRDLVIISAYPIPGNENSVGRIVNLLMKLGAEVVYERYSLIHVSGHACQDEQKLMLALTKPQFFIPVHGEYKHMTKHCSLAASMGMSEENIHIPDIGEVIEVSVNGITVGGPVTSGCVLVDGLGVGDVGSVVLRDRKHLGEDGIMVISVILNENGEIVAGPDLVSRGFVYVRDSEELIRATKSVVSEAVRQGVSRNRSDWQNLKTKIKDAAADYLYGLTQRTPMILPVIEMVKSNESKPSEF